MSAFAVAVFHDAALPAGARAVEAVVWIRSAGLGEAGVDVALTVWTPAHAEVVGLREVVPATADRLADCARLDERTARIEGGRWVDGVHEFELVIALPERRPGDEMLAARVGVLADGEEVAGALVAVRWTEAASAHAATPASGGAASAEDADASRPAANAPPDAAHAAAVPPADTAAARSAAGSGADDAAARTTALVPPGADADAARTAAATRADLPTGPSPGRRQTGAGEGGAAVPCAGCGELPEAGDRFCEACGRDLSSG